MIRRVSGLESTRCLEELYLAKQRLPLGEALTFDQASIDGIKVQSPSAGQLGTTEFWRRYAFGSEIIHSHPAHSRRKFSCSGK